ncbi:MAG: 3-phosphoshikimate 1-carboxyvinyltransferase [Candidatus Zixiibacteriota bacterium]
MQKSLRGEIRVGGDKSISHRAVMLAALAHGTTRLHNLARGQDVQSTIRLYQKLGLGVAGNNGTIELAGGGLESLKTESEILYCGNSGTTLRLSLGIVAGTKVECRLLGDESLNRRPVKRVIVPLRLMGGNLTPVESDDRPPVFVRGRKLHGINVSTVIASAQVKSAILFAGLHAEGVTSVTEPDKSRDHTEIMFKHLGCNIDVEGKTAILSPMKRIEAFEYAAPGDVSTAMFFIVAALITPGSELAVRDVLLNPTRTGAITILRAMGADIQEDNAREQHGEAVGDLIVRSSPLHGFDAAEIVTATYIDEAPALAAAAMFAEGETSFHHIGELRMKESDRASGIVNILKSYGCEARLDDDILRVKGSGGTKTGAANHLGDHRLAMMMEIIDLGLSGSINGGYGETISVSAPEFYELMKGLLK